MSFKPAQAMSVRLLLFRNVQAYLLTKTLLKYHKYHRNTTNNMEIPQMEHPHVRNTKKQAKQDVACILTKL